MSGVRQRMVCDHCRSSEISRDAWAEWDAGHQAWRLGAIFDDAYCHGCHQRTHLAAEPLADEPRTPLPIAA